MLCPKCRRQVGKDGYCPEGHPARPDVAPPSQPPTRVPPREAYRSQSEQVLPADPALWPPASTGGLAPSYAVDAPPRPKTDGAPPPPPVPAEGATDAAKRSRKPIVAVTAFAVLVVGTLGFMAFGRSASAANLFYSYAPGEVHRYAMSMTFDIKATLVDLGALAFDGAMETTLVQRTLSVDEDGVATVQLELGTIRFTERRSVVQIPAPGKVVTVKMAPDGSVLDADGKGILSFAAANPMAGFAEMALPESLGPLLPDHKVEPGQNWDISEDMANPFGKTIRFEGRATLLQRSGEGEQEVAAIQSEVNMPFNIDASVNDLAKYAGAEPASELRGARMTFNGFLSGDLTQSLAIKSGFLKSALGDITMTGTLGFIDVPGMGDVEAIMNAAISFTLTEIA